MDTSVTLLLLWSCSTLFRRLVPRLAVFMASAGVVDDAVFPPGAEDSALLVISHMPAGAILAKIHSGAF